MTAAPDPFAVDGLDRRPVRFRVTGADGRRVGTFSASELRWWQRRIRHAVRHGGAPHDPARPVHNRPDPRLPAELFTLDALDAAGEVLATTTWRPER